MLTVGTAICGCTAVLAIAPILRATAAQTGYAVATVMLLGVCGVSPIRSSRTCCSHSSRIAAGIFLGTAIHDTSQVVGAGLVYCAAVPQPAGAGRGHGRQVAAQPVTRRGGARSGLARGRERHAQSGVAWAGLTTYVPWFVVGFIAVRRGAHGGRHRVASGNTLLQQRWDGLLDDASHAADWCLTIGMAATGMTLSRAGLSSLGLKPLLAGLCAAALVAVTQSAAAAGDLLKRWAASIAGRQATPHAVRAGTGSTVWR